MIPPKHLRRKMELIAIVLIASTSFSHGQSFAPPATGISACELPNPRKTISESSDFARYREDNDMLEHPAPGQKRVVFFGSSSIDNWGRRFDSTFFSGKPYINRGISGETTPQMLLRFERDVVALKPAAVVFLGGTNDIAGNTGPMTLDMTEENISAMAAIAEANGIRMILASQLPVKAFPWRTCLRPETDLLALTAWEKNFAGAHQLGFVDFYTALVGSDGSFRPGLSSDGVHPDKKAYEIMTPIVEKVISNVLNQR